MYTGGLAGTAGDMARFLSLQFQEGEPGGAQILSADSLRQMRTPAAPGGAGLGWWTAEVEGHPFFEHSGGHVGFLATIGGLPDLKVGVVVMTNTFNPIWGAQHTQEIARLLYRTLISALAPPARPAFDPASVELSRYAGTYAVAGRFAEIRMEVADGRLWHTVVGSAAPRQAAYPVAHDQFSLGQPGGAPALFFETDAQGRVSAVRFALFRFERQ